MRTLTERQGLQFGSPDEIAFEKKWISETVMQKTIKKLIKSTYGMYLEKIFLKG